MKQQIQSPLQELVTVTLPMATGLEENFVFVGLNGKGYTVMRGVDARVPRPVFEILKEARRQQERQSAYIRACREHAGREAAGPEM